METIYRFISAKKAILLHNTNILTSIPVAFCYVKEKYDYEYLCDS